MIELQFPKSELKKINFAVAKHLPRAFARHMSGVAYEGMMASRKQMTRRLTIRNKGFPRLIRYRGARSSNLISSVYDAGASKVLKVLEEGGWGRSRQFRNSRPWGKNLKNSESFKRQIPI